MRIVWVAPYHFDPGIAGGPVRLGRVLDAVLRAGHDVDLWVLDAKQPGDDEPRPGLQVRRFAGRGNERFLDRARSVMSPLPKWSWMCDAQDVREAFACRMRQPPDLVALDELHTGFLAGLTGQVPVMCLLTNVESQAQRDLAATSSKRLRRLRLHQESLKLRRLEDTVVRQARSLVAVSESDAEVLRLRGAREVVVARNGVDTSRYEGVWVGPPDRPAIQMTANFQYEPNDVGAKWLVESVMPLVWRMLPDVELRLVGAGPPQWMLEKGVTDRRVDVTGQVDDVRPFLAEASVTAVPLLSGGGTSLKVAEALATGMPIVSTTVGARGYALEGLATVVDGAAEFAAALVHSVAEPESLDAVGARRQYARDELDWRVTLRPLISALAEVLRAPDR